MKQVKLIKTAQIPDETYTGKPPVPSATNYAGAVLRLGDEIADKLIAEGKAELHVPDAPRDDLVRETERAPTAPFGEEE